MQENEELRAENAKLKELTQQLTAKYVVVIICQAVVMSFVVCVAIYYKFNEIRYIFFPSVGTMWVTSLAISVIKPKYFLSQKLALGYMTCGAALAVAIIVISNILIGLM